MMRWGTWGLERNHPLLAALKSLTEDPALSVSAGDVILLQGNWYVTWLANVTIALTDRVQSVCPDYSCGPKLG